MRGKTISIYIPDANPRGLKICEITNSIVKGIFIPRSNLSEGLLRNELKNPGIYFLIGEKNEIGKQIIYIGEAEVLLNRIKQHNSSKDFWNTIICFISEKNNINKAHIKYLEGFACRESLRLNKSELVNATQPSSSQLTEQDEDFALSFFDDLKLIIATLGFPIFEENKKEEMKLFFCKSGDLIATGEYTEDGFVVFKNSEASLTHAPSISIGIKNKIESLIDANVLEVLDNKIIFKEDYIFNSPSQAAATVLARHANGWTEWKDKNGITLDEKIRKNNS